MKKEKVLYWITTGLVSAAMLFTAVSYFTLEEMKSSFERLGFPDFFRIELGIAKGIGAVVLLLPFMPGRLKEAAYIGFAITFISAIVAHLAQEDPLYHSLQALALLAMLGGSYTYFVRIRKTEER